MPTRHGIDYQRKMAIGNFDLNRAFREFSAQLSNQVEAQLNAHVTQFQYQLD